MKIAIVSDTHNNEFGVMDALKEIRAEGIETIIHCGDMTSGDTAELFSDFCIHHVRGNGDIDQFGIDIAIEACRPGSTSGLVYTALIDGKKIAALHGHNANMYFTLLESGTFDYIFHGHTHHHRDEMDGKTRIINPGAIGGAHRGTRGFCTLDMLDGKLTFHEME